MGSRATVSAGLAVLHYKEDLRLALDVARKAEKAAKNGGRDALQISVCRRSGEHATALCPWDFAAESCGKGQLVVEQWVQAFLPNGPAPGASDRWAYHLREEVETLRGLPAAAMRAEIRRQVGRSDESTRRRFGQDGNPKAAGDTLAAAFDQYRNLDKPRDRDGQPSGRRFADDGEALAQFITLCQTASFLARARDE